MLKQQSIVAKLSLYRIICIYLIQPKGYLQIQSQYCSPATPYTQLATFRWSY